MVIIIVNGLKSEIRNKPAKNDAMSASSGGGFGDSGDSGATLFVGGLPFGVGEDDVRKFLQENIPNAQNVRVPIDRVDNSIKGIAFVELGSDADVNVVINQVSNLKMGGRSLKINQSVPKIIERPRGSRGAFGGRNLGRGRGGNFSGGFGRGRFSDPRIGSISIDEDAAHLAARRRQQFAGQLLFGLNTDDEW